MKRIIEIKATATEIAEAFWHLGDDGQTEFFAEIERIAVEDVGAAQAEMQWCYMGDRIRANERACHAMRSLSAFCWLHLLRIF